MSKQGSSQQIREEGDVVMSVIERFTTDHSQNCLDELGRQLIGSGLSHFNHIQVGIDSNSESSVVQSERELGLKRVG